MHAIVFLHAPDGARLGQNFDLCSMKFEHLLSVTTLHAEIICMLLLVNVKINFISLRSK